MRVIAGTYRSRALLAPRGMETRPTSDRLRETLFNILAVRVPGSNFADLYAGSGAVGIEALSRGAAQVWFAEKSEAALAAIRANLKALKIARGFALDERGTGALLERLAKSAQKAQDGNADARAETARLSVHSESYRRDVDARAETTRSGLKLDLIYLDPPWEAEAEYANTLHLLGSTRGAAILAADAMLIAEHSSKTPLASRYGELVQTRTLKQGDASLSFYAVATA